uniref:Uncharacterized protein n=1 Tax=Tetranychus urticae TaxID=32264 RepID=T1JPS5_TETUR
MLKPTLATSIILFDYSGLTIKHNLIVAA